MNVLTDLLDAIDSLITYHIPASVRSFAALDAELISLIENESEDSEGHQDALTVMQTAGGRALMANTLGINVKY